MSTILIDRLLSPEVRAISYGALEQMSLDLMQCESEIKIISSIQIITISSLCFEDQYLQFR